MSHFTKLATHLVDGATLRTALASMGYEPIEVGDGVVGYSGGRAAAEFKIQVPGSFHEIGFSASKRGYEVVADWWGLRSLDQQQFVSTLKRQYAESGALAQFEAEGFELDSTDRLEDGEVRLVFRRVIG